MLYVFWFSSHEEVFARVTRFQPVEKNSEQRYFQFHMLKKLVRVNVSDSALNLVYPTWIFFLRIW